MWSDWISDLIFLGGSHESVGISIEAGMKLFHATTSLNLDSILKDGIKPRGKTERSNWDGVTTRTDLVYLSKCHGPAIALDVTKRNGGIGLILEVNVRMKEFGNLLPDEDLRVYDEKWGDKKNTKTTEQVNGSIAAFRKQLHKHQSEWPRSLNIIGSVAYRRGIAADDITRYCLIDFGQRQLLAAQWIESTSDLNWGMHIGSGLTQWLFGDQAMLPKLQKNNDEEMRIRESNDRTGIDAVNAPFGDACGPPPQVRRHQ